MTNLVRYDNNDIELVIDQDTGAAFTSIAGYARMSGVSYPTVKKRVERLNSGDIYQLESAEIPTASGIRVVTLLPASLIFEWALKDNLPLAKAMGSAGATVYLHQLAGFKVSTT